MRISSTPIVIKQNWRFKKRLGPEECVLWLGWRGSRAATKQQVSMLHRAWETTLDPPLYYDKGKLAKKYCHPLVFVQAETERSPFQETRGYNWEARKRELPKRWNKWKWLTFHVKKKKLSIKRLKCFSRTQAPCRPVHNPIKDGLSTRNS